MTDIAGNPSLPEALRIMINNRMSLINTGLPGIVEEYEPGTCKARVTPAVTKIYLDEEEIELRPIENVNVQFPRSKDFIFHFPINKGDYVWLLFSQRDLDNWKIGGGVSKPGTRRKYDSMDAVAIPGIYPFNEPSGVTDNESVYLQYKNASIVIKDNGRVDINNGNLTIDV